MSGSFIYGLLPSKPNLIYTKQINLIIMSGGKLAASVRFSLICP